MADPLTPKPADAGVTGELRHDTAVGSTPLTSWSTTAGRSAAHAAVQVSRRIGAHGALAATLAIGVVVVFLLAFLASRVYDAVTERDGVAGLDVPVLHAAIGMRSPVSDGIAAAVAIGFGPVGMPILALVAILLLALRRRSWTPVILIAAAGLGSLAMTIAGKDIIGRHRPLHIDAIPPFETSPSFPSGHTLNATVIAGVVAYLLVLRRRTAAGRTVTVAAAVVIALVVGLTRILLGAHWFTDVLAGWLLGLAWLGIVITAHRLYLTARQRGAPA
ncbi:phosphatase PAP2 family protein [Amnibacterium sp.]|uniref:phosphatase PAP2 family protein n=1 Tax=Amnibacterium sp. TaxID=1872496 RepID=UPI0026206475|nr:phosphatase PAP2 family protein [Amnibacterium sp.]MCU1474411.1 putative rane-associated phospholipid phosphatase [Amnibacterium sp.]